MPFVYSVVPAVNVTTSGTADTEVDHLRLLTVAARPCYLNACYVLGKGAGLTAISGIVIRIKRFTTPSTVGAAVAAANLQGRDPEAPTARTTFFTGPTVGTTPFLRLAIGCGAAGPGGWVAPNPESQIAHNAGGGAFGNGDLFSASGTVSLNFEYSLEYSE